MKIGRNNPLNKIESNMPKGDQRAHEKLITNVSTPQ